MKSILINKDVRLNFEISILSIVLYNQSLVINY